MQAEAEQSVGVLAHRFGVTPMTIRRDLDALERQGMVLRTHGGAVLARPGIVEFRFAERRRTHASQKQAIARAVAGIVRPGMKITLDTGTTTLEVARAIAGVPEITVLTTSLAIASVLYACEHIELVLMGGTVRKNDPDLSGVLTEQNLRCFHVDLAVLGADAVSAEGVYTTDMGIARGSQAMMVGAQRKVLVADELQV